MTTDEALMTASEIARLAGVGRAAVGNWRKRHADFPSAAGGTETSPAFRRGEVEEWLRANGKLDDRLDAERLWQRLDTYRWSGRTAAVLAGVGIVLLRGEVDLDLRTWTERHYPDLSAALDDEVERDASVLAADVLTVAAAEGVQKLFERLCGWFVDARSGQVHATPPELAELMVALAGAGVRDLLDPACGTGSLLMAAYRSGITMVRGQELEPGMAMLARVRATLAGAEVTVREGNTLLRDAFASEPAVDAVVTNPPFGLRDWQGDDAHSDPRWSYGLPPRSESELAWVQHCLAHVDVDGAVVVLMPPGAATRAAGRRIRAELARQALLRSVIALPPGSLPESGIAPLVWLLDRDPQRTPEDGVVMIDASRHVLEGRRVDWNEVRREVDGALAEPDTAPPDVARRVPTIELLDDEVSLLPQRYLRSAPAPARDLTSTRDRLLSLLDIARTAVPSVAEAAQPVGVRWIPLGDLARSGALRLLSSPSRLDVADDGDGSLVLTARDVAAGRAASGRLAATLDSAPVELQVGDVVMPQIAQRPVARVVAEDGVMLGPNVIAVRPRTDVIDPWYLAGVLQGEHISRASTTGSGSFRISPRAVEVPVLPLAEQKPLATAFRQLAQLEAALGGAAQIGTELAASLRAGLADGSLRPADETLTTRMETTSPISEGDA